MNRLLALVAVASLGTGCVMSSDTCDVRSVVIRWSDFNRADGSVMSSCGSGPTGVNSVSVYMDDLFVANLRCIENRLVEVTDVPAGSHTWRVEALRGDGAILYRDVFTSSGGSCDQLFVDTRPAAGYLDLRYRFFDGASPLPSGEQLCAASSFLWLSVFDNVLQDYAVRVDSDATPQTYPCVDPSPDAFVIPLPIGDYTLDWMEEHGPANTYDLESADCTSRDFTIFAGNGSAGDGTVVPVELDVAAPAQCVRPSFLRQARTSGN
jgi:hypothetical protein